MMNQERRADRRVERTRQLLQQAFVEVVREKGFAATSIQDITERANLNRGTFYLHFTDKYMLVDSFVREDFRRLLARKLPATSRWDRDSLYLLIDTILDSFEKKYQHQQHVPRAVAPLVERAIHEELTALLLTWLRQCDTRTRSWPVSMEALASIVGWAIFGPAIQWSQEDTTQSKAEMARAILLVVTEGVAHLAPGALLA